MTMTLLVLAYFFFRPKHQSSNLKHLKGAIERLGNDREERLKSSKRTWIF